MAKETVPIKVPLETRRDYKIVAAMLGLEMGQLAQIALDQYKKKVKLPIP